MSRPEQTIKEVMEAALHRLMRGEGYDVVLKHLFTQHIGEDWQLIVKNARPILYYALVDKSGKVVATSKWFDGKFQSAITRIGGKWYNVTTPICPQEVKDAVRAIEIEQGLRDAN